jgi:hypothetical protein
MKTNPASVPIQGGSQSFVVSCAEFTLFGSPIIAERMFFRDQWQKDRHKDLGYGSARSRDPGEPDVSKVCEHLQAISRSRPIAIGAKSTGRNRKHSSGRSAIWQVLS